ncbi:hypothetical protein [Methyloferula stellata]|uniref:hypothetical protein n=1 Tax=Methyloferula stellata TaxID=876270 RepID=UPI000362AF04|nr:hypothetical protein [Methyloferula stellata]
MRAIWAKTFVSQLADLWRRIRSFGLAVLLVLLAAACVTSGLFWWIDAAHNRVIRALAEGHAADVPLTAAPELIFAGAYFLLERGRIDEAQPLLDVFDRGKANPLRPIFHYDMANARLKQAFDKIEGGDLESAEMIVNLAREDYKAALRLDPELWDARYNLDVASRLVRDMPAFRRSGEDERRRDPQNLWTELPILPRGEP